MEAIFGEARLFKAGHGECRGEERFPVVRQRAMEPDELGSEMVPRRIDALAALEIGGRPAVGNAAAFPGRARASLREAWVREHQHGGSTDRKTRWNADGSFQIRKVHQHVVGGEQIETLICDGVQLGAGIHAERDFRGMSSRDCDHAFREIDACNHSPSIGATASGLSAALQDVGLRLESMKAPVEVLVIDLVERPSEN